MERFESQPRKKENSPEQYDERVMLAENMFQMYYEETNKVDSIANALLLSGGSLRRWFDTDGKKAIKAYAETHTDADMIAHRDMDALVKKYREDSDPTLH